MAPRKKVEEQLNLPLAPADLPKAGELLVNMDVGLAVGRLITASKEPLVVLEEEFDALVSGGDLVEAAGTIEGNAALKAHLKQCSSLRTALDRAHKDAKAPFWDACKTLDAKLKALKGIVETFEEPAKVALATYENKQAKLAADAQAARLAELEAENAKLRGRLEEENVIPPFEDKQAVVTVRGRESAQAARTLFGDSGYDEVKTDERGVNYILEVVLRRKEIQNA